MKTREASVGGHKVTLAVPESVEEYDSLAKKQGACLDAATDYEVFHGTLGEIRDKFCELIAKTHGIERREIGTGVFEGEGEEKKEVTKTERFETYLTRVAAEKNLKGETPFQDIADSMSSGGANEVHFDPSVKVRQPGTGPKLPKYAEAQAIRFLDKTPHPTTGKVSSLPKFAQAYHKLVGKELPELTGDRAKDIKILGAACVEYQNAQDVFSKMSE